MAESRVNKDNYIVIQGFMLTDLHLKGNELIIYACIYGFSQAENQTFSGSLQYLADWTNSTRQSVINCLKSLVEKGFIEKTEKIINGVKFCDYRTTNITQVVKKVDYPVKESLTGGSKESLPNNIDIDNLKNNIDIKNNNDQIQKEFENLWKLYPRKIGKPKALKAYQKARKKGVTYEEVEKGITAYCKQIKANKTKPEYIKHGATWFNGECWADEYETIKNNKPVFDTSAFTL